jgi:hypothetical protein
VREEEMIETPDNEALGRIEDLLTALARAALHETLRNAVKDKKNRIVYENTGELSVKEIAKRTGFSAGKISGLWQEWEQAGLLIKKGKYYKRII